MAPTGAAVAAATAASVAASMTRVVLAPAPPGALACQRDSSLRSLRTAIHACHERVVPATKKSKAQRFYELELEDTVLFPEGGGQPWDTGNIDGVPVDQVYVKDGRCVHRVLVKSGAGPPFTEGQEVVASLVSMDTAAASVEAGKKAGKEKSVIPADVLEKIEVDVNEAIVQGLAMTPSLAKPGTQEWKKIAAKFEPGQMPKAMRIVTIDGLDVNPCCGTHVQNLAHLRSLRVLSTESARGATRVWFVAGDRVNREFSRMLKNEHAMTKMLSSAPEVHASRVEKLLQFQKSASKELKKLQKELAASIARDLATRASEGDANDTLFVLTAGEQHDEGLFLIAGPPAFISTHGRSVLPLIDGKGGGGKNGVIQGKAKRLSKIDSLVAKLQELRLQK
uniref:Threonyl/alanyl tRNA synthetase SAD domain-containing protein n=1 Tax=Phytophthora ramorum TaxID=164328 RepID=H3HDB9_PHYRM